MSLNHERLQGQKKCIFSGLSPSIDDSMWRRRRKGQRERERVSERGKMNSCFCAAEKGRKCVRAQVRILVCVYY